MCCNTKKKIADGLAEMMRQKPLRKITVQDIMDCGNMKRQSFYYHFQDIYEVIEWTCEEGFIKPASYDETETLEVLIPDKSNIKSACRIVWTTNGLEIIKEVTTP